MKKIVFGVVLSREIQDATPGTASAVIGAVMSAQASRSLDAVVFSNSAATAAAPGGLLNGVVALPASAQPTAVDAATEDVAALAAAIAAANIDASDMVLVASTKQATVLSLMKVPFKVYSSLALPAGTIVGVAPAALGSSFNAPLLDTSVQTVVHAEDSTPKEIVSTPGVSASPSRSLFQEDLIAVRCRAEATWSVITPGGIAMINATNW
jgi:hypothetical protein